MTFEDYWSAVDNQPVHIPGTVPPPPGVTPTRTDLLSSFKNAYNRLGLGGAPQGSGLRFGEPMPGEATIGPDEDREMAAMRRFLPLPPGISNAIRSIAPNYTPDNTNLRAAPNPMAGGVMSAPPPPWIGPGISNDEMNRRFPGLNLPPSNPAPDEGTMYPTPVSNAPVFARRVPPPPRMSTWGDYFQRLAAPTDQRQDIEREMLQDQTMEKESESRRLQEFLGQGPPVF